MGYSERNAILRRLGYESYAAYLASPLWRAIRRRVLKRDGLNCCLCPAAATEVHHDDYGEAMLEGRSISRLKLPRARLVAVRQ